MRLIRDKRHKINGKIRTFTERNREDTASNRVERERRKV
jgi:hypothetical protein